MPLLQMVYCAVINSALTDREIIQSNTGNHMSEEIYQHAQPVPRALKVYDFIILG